MWTLVWCLVVGGGVWTLVWCLIVAGGRCCIGDGDSGGGGYSSKAVWIEFTIYFAKRLEKLHAVSESIPN